MQCYYTCGFSPPKVPKSHPKSKHNCSAYFLTRSKKLKLFANLFGEQCVSRFCRLAAIYFAFLAEIVQHAARFSHKLSRGS
jgi:hypothetical protein